jgi:hypothetical protein
MRLLGSCLHSDGVGDCASAEADICDFNGSRFTSFSPCTMATIYAQVRPGHEAACITD